MKKLYYFMVINLIVLSFAYGKIHNVLSAPMFNQNSYFADVEILEIENNTSTDTINFGVVLSTEGWCLSKQYVKLHFNFEGTIVIYTNNSSSDTGYQKAGLVSTDNKWRVPLVWMSSTNIVSLADLESLKPTSYALASPLRYIKDKNDLDDPTTPIDESWDEANSTGYTFVWRGLPTPSTFYLYFYGDFSNVAGGKEYYTIIYLDFTSDPFPPRISHIPITKIYNINNIVIQADVVDDQKVEEVTLFYEYNNSSYTLRMQPRGSSIYEGVIHSTVCLVTEKLKYYIEATDGLNIKKTDEYEIEILVKTGKKFLGVTKGRLVLEDGNPYDGETYIFIPEGALDKPTDIKIKQRNPKDLDIPKGTNLCLSENPLVVYEFFPDTLKFKKPVDLCLLYYDLDNNGKVEFFDGTETQFNESQLRIFFWDGFEWRPLGGKIDTERNTINTKISHFSLYAIFPAKSLSISDLRPKEKIITPSLKDGINDFATFDGLYDDYEIKIFDITGRLVKKLTPSVGNIWDGTDELGNIVESGVYIYQINTKINGERKIVSGTITVAK